MAICSWSFIGTLVALFYLYTTFHRLYELANPLSGLPADAMQRSRGLIYPLWKEDYKLHLTCFLSPSKYTSQKSNEDRELIWQQTELVYNSSHREVSTLISLNQSHHPMPKIWRAIHSNRSEVYLHVYLSTKTLQSTGDTLHGVVKLIKYEKIPKAFKFRYLLSDYGYVQMSDEEKQRISLPSSTVISYWKPEVAIRLVNDHSIYPSEFIPQAIAENSFRVNNRMVYKPAVHVDEIGLTSDKYIPLNDSVDSLPLKISFAPMSLQRWLLMREMEESIASQASLGFSDKDIDDVRRLISDTSIYLLAITMIASLLHLLFEFLAFQSDITFWRNNKSVAGLSTRAVVTELVSQSVVFLFLVDQGASLLVSVPAALGIMIQLWKVQKATGLTIKGLSIHFERWEKEVEENGEDTKGGGVSRAELTKVTLEADFQATFHLAAIFVPLSVGSIVKSLLFDKHASWYSWFIGALTGCVYAGGFTLMCPQLFINHKLKSVSHLPWKFLIYKFLNTFIDDLFAFVIKMPTMHRISVFRDDIVFLIYLYQRWIYRVDTSRPFEK